MESQECNRRFVQLSTPLIADACVRLKLPIRSAPTGLMSLLPGSKVAGRALPVKHHGSVDIFLEIMIQAKSGDVLCIDDGCRTDQSCIGDLTALEAQAFGIAALLVWGRHRDTSELERIGLPIFSYGRNPAGPLKAEPRTSTSIGFAQFGTTTVSSDDYVFVDSDGAVFVRNDELENVFETATNIAELESRQAQAVRDGINLHTQLQFDDFIKERAKNPSLSFREHLRSIAKAVEE